MCCHLENAIEKCVDKHAASVLVGIVSLAEM